MGCAVSELACQSRHRCCSGSALKPGYGSGVHSLVRKMIVCSVLRGVLLDGTRTEGALKPFWPRLLNGNDNRIRS